MIIACKLLVIITLIISKIAYSDEGDDEVCFYTEDYFQGEKTCLHSGRQIDLYHEYISSFLLETDPSIIDNDSINSINIPPG
ncbi:hypothetical protein, partial [Yersinia aleksiciae]